MVLCMLRVSMPDRPGTLAALAQALARAGADIVDVSVVDRPDAAAVDDLCVETGEALLEDVRRAAESVRGVVLESIRTVDRPRDPVAAVALASRLAAPGHDGVALLVDGIPDALWATWCLAIERRGGELVVRAASPGAPARSMRDAPWLPLDVTRRLPPARWMPPAWLARAGGGGLELAATPLGSPRTAVLVARHFGARFRPPELRQLELLAGMVAGRIRLAAAG